MGTSRREVLAGGAASLAALAAGAPAKAADPVRIGYSMSLTGLFAEAAPSQVSAYEMWRDQVNASGGMDVGGQKRKIEFVRYDDQSSPANAVKIYEKLITQDKVDLLAAPWGTPFQIAIAPVVTRYKFPVVGNTAASVQLRKLAPGYIWFPTSAIPDKMGDQLAKMAKAKGVKTAVVISNVLPFSQEVKSFLLPALDRDGVKVLVNEDYPPDIKDMTALLSKAAAAKADAVLALSYPEDSFLFARQAKELGLKAPFMFVMVGPTFAAFQKAYGDSVNNIVTIGHWSKDKKEWAKAKPFYDAYVARYHEKPDALDTVLSYMSMEILQQAVAKAGLDKEKLRQTISSDTFDTIDGPVKFKGVENILTPTSFLQIQDGDMQIVWPESFKTAEFRPKEKW
jgi:branched-chain amino acid transport system substrate-binding protein